MERDTRFELVSYAWKAQAQPLYQSRFVYFKYSNMRKIFCQAFSEQYFHATE